MTILGIDPGLTGAIALLHNDGKLIGVHDMPAADGLISGSALRTRIRSLCEDLPDTIDMAVVEHVSAMPGQGVSSMFKFGAAFGVAMGVVGGMFIPMHLVRPSKWKREMGLGSDKGRALRMATGYWPDHAHSFERKKDADRAEAALLALWWIERGGR